MHGLKIGWGDIKPWTKDEQQETLNKMKDYNSKRDEMIKYMHKGLK